MTRHQHCEQENLPKRFSYTAIQKLTEKHLRRITKIALYLFNHVSQEQTSWTVFLKIRTHNIFWPKYRTVGKYGRRYARACLAFPGAWWDLFSVSFATQGCVTVDILLRAVSKICEGPVRCCQPSPLVFSPNPLLYQSYLNVVVSNRAGWDEN